MSDQPGKRNLEWLGRLTFAAALHFAIFTFAFFKCLYFTFPGEPGYDAARAAASDLYRPVVQVLGFPILWIAETIRPLHWVFDGVTGWLWFLANSILWGWLICGIIVALNRRRA